MLKEKLTASDSVFMLNNYILTDFIFFISPTQYINLMEEDNHRLLEENQALHDELAHLNQVIASTPRP